MFLPITEGVKGPLMSSRLSFPDFISSPSSPSCHAALKLCLTRSELVVMVFMKECGHFSVFAICLLK